MIRKDDTFTQVAKQLQTDWQTPLTMNTGALGRPKNSDDSLIRVATSVKTESGSFAAFLGQASKKSESPEKSQISSKAADYTKFETGGPKKTGHSIIQSGGPLKIEQSSFASFLAGTTKTSEKSEIAAKTNESTESTAGKSKKTDNPIIQAGAPLKIEYNSFVSFLDQAARMNDRPVKPPTMPKANEYKEYTVKPGDTLWEIAVKKMHVNLKDLVSDNDIKNPDLISPGQTIKIRQHPKSQVPSQVVASWYGKDFQGKPMANGSPYNMYANTIAHKDLPLGTKVELNNPRTGQKSTAVITDRGPFVSGRDVDLSYGLARKLSLVKEGVDTLVMRIL